jgi:hypothetical protein
MIVLLDSNANFVEAALARWPQVNFGQLRTPLTRFRRNALKPWAIDNGCFSRFAEGEWRAMLDEARGMQDDQPVFVTLPDVVCSARRTAELFPHFLDATKGLRRAIVLQNGIEGIAIPWSEIDAVFVGGDNDFKVSPVAKQACTAAKILGRWVHVGRVNTAARVRDWMGLADSIDGSGISRYTDTLDGVCAEIAGGVSGFPCMGVAETEEGEG